MQLAFLEASSTLFPYPHGARRPPPLAPANVPPLVELEAHSRPVSSTPPPPDRPAPVLHRFHLPGPTSTPAPPPSYLPPLHPGARQGEIHCHERVRYQMRCLMRSLCSGASSSATYAAAPSELAWGRRAAETVTLVANPATAAHRRGRGRGQYFGVGYGRRR